MFRRNFHRLTVSFVLGLFAPGTLGAQWVQTNGPYFYSYPTVNDFAGSGANVFAATDSGLVFSPDAGNHWSSLHYGLTNFAVFGVAICGPYVFAGSIRWGVLRSSDNGTDWTEVNEGLASAEVHRFAVSDTNIFVIGIDGGVYFSSNYGTTWKDVSTGLPNRNVSCLAVKGADVFAGTRYPGGVFRTTDNGSTWTTIIPGEGWNTYIPYLAVTESNIFLLRGYALYRAAIDGSDMTYLPVPSPQTMALKGTDLYIGTHLNGIYKSTDAGVSWTSVSNGLGLGAESLISLFCSGSNIYAGTWSEGIFLSKNEGELWEEANDGLQQSVRKLNRVSSLTVTGTDLYAATNGGIARTTDNGLTWTTMNNGLSTRDVVALTVDGTDIFAGTYDGGVFLSTNRGSTWNAVNTGLLSLAAWDIAVSGTNLFAATYGGGVFLSTNKGLTWTAVNTGLTSLYLRSVAAKDTSLFVGDDMVSISTNNGANWQPANAGLPDEFIPLIEAIGPGLFAGVGYSGLYRSADNGTNWTAANAGIENVRVFALVSSGTNLFAGAYYAGVFLSTDNGISWNAVNAGLTGTQTRALAVLGEYLFTGGDDGPVSRRPLSEMITNVSTPDDIVPTTVTLAQNYPNPFNPSTTIRFGLPARSHITLTVYNTLGQEVATLVQGEKEAGYHEVKFDGTGLSSGVYFYRMTAGDYVATKKLLILK